MEERTVELIWVGGESNQRQAHKGHLEIWAQCLLLMLSRDGKRTFLFSRSYFQSTKWGWVPANSCLLTKKCVSGERGRGGNSLLGKVLCNCNWSVRSGCKRQKHDEIHWIMATADLRFKRSEHVCSTHIHRMSSLFLSHVLFLNYNILHVWLHVIQSMVQNSKGTKWCRGKSKSFSLFLCPQPLSL